MRNASLPFEPDSAPAAFPLGLHAPRLPIEDAPPSPRRATAHAPHAARTNPAAGRIPAPSTHKAPSLPMLHLASQSPRRRQLLTEAGLPHAVIHPGLDDGELAPGAVAPADWVMALAYLKASAGAATLAAQGHEAHAVLGADTVCVVDGRIIGQPKDAAHATQIIHDLADREHDVLTGVALVDTARSRRDVFFDRARVRVGAIPPHELHAYVQSGAWRGKAGAYNLFERIDAGWPIEYDGDPTTIMGLPMARLTDALARWHAAPAA